MAVAEAKKVVVKKPAPKVAEAPKAEPKAAPVEEKAPETVKMVTVNDLAEKHGIEGRKIRIIIRASGRRAPATGGEGFGPRAKYSWPEGSEELAEVEELIIEAGEKAATAAGKAEKLAKKEKAKAEPVDVEEELEEDENLEEDEEDEEE